MKSTSHILGVEKMKSIKSCMVLGITSITLIGMGALIYNCVLSPKTKKEMCRLEKDMCNDLENMM